MNWMLQLQRNHNIMALLLVLYFLLVWFVRTACSGPVFDVTDFGAVADGETDSSQALLRAWTEACAVHGTPRVVIPKGEYLVHPLVLRGPCKGYMTVRVGGVLKAPEELDAFWGRHEWIHFASIDGLSVAGGGTFDGRGAFSWPLNECQKKRDCKLLPASIKLGHVTNATVAHITSLNSKFFHVVVVGSRDVGISGVIIRAPRDSPNTDGIHIQNSTGISISGSAIGTGDDCISLGPGSTDVSISDVSCGPGHGISVGSLGRYAGEDDVSGLRVVNCTLAGTTNGVRIKTWRGVRASSVSDLLFDGIEMRRVHNPIIIDQEYCPYSSCDGVLSSMVKISDVKFRNIRGVSATQVAVKLLCSQAAPCQKLELRDINLEYVKHGVATESLCANVADGIAAGTLVPPPCI